MPKRKLPSSSSPPQPSLKYFLPIRKSLPHPVSKRAKLVSLPPSPQKEEAGPPSCPNSPSTDELVQLFEYIDEVLLFSGKPLLWGHIQEEVFSLHERSIEVEVLRRIMGTMQGVYTIEVGWKRNGEGVWKADYKLSIPASETPTRLSRFQTALSTISFKSVSEYTLPALPSKPPTITPATEKKSQLIKSVLPSSTTKPVSKGLGPQKPISVFLAPKKKECNKETLAARKGALLLRIREKSTIQPPPEIDNGPWERAEWVVSSLFMILSQHTGKTKFAVSMSGTIAQLIGSSSVPLSYDTTRDVILLICRSVPWFVQIITLNKEGCMSSQSTKTTTTTNTTDKGRGVVGGGGVRKGKENRAGGKQVEGLVIFAKRDGQIICREQVLCELRAKRTELGAV